MPTLWTNKRTGDTIQTEYLAGDSDREQYAPAWDDAEWARICECGASRRYYRGTRLAQKAIDAGDDCELGYELMAKGQDTCRCCVDECGIVHSFDRRSWVPTDID